MTVSINGTNGLTFSDGSAQNTGGYTGFRNRIINGDMRIDQRNAGASVTVTAAGAGFAVDRFPTFNQCDGGVTAQQISDAPSGFSNSLRVTITSADSNLGSAQYVEVRQLVEGFNVADLGWGTAAAQTVTLSFWVKSSLTGTFGGSFMNSAVNRAYPFAYTISSANTWEQKTITVPGDTTGTWEKTNGNGMFVILNLGAGSDFQGTANAWTASRKQTVSGAVSLVATNGATWQVTGVQLEAGSVATPFERRPYGTELALCQRYTIGYSGGAGYRLGSGFAYSTTAGYCFFNFPVTMRIAPSIEGTASLMTFNDAIAGYNASNAPTINSSQENFISLTITGASGMTAYRVSQIYFTSASSKLILSSEL